MSGTTRCDLCTEPGTLAGARDLGQVPCNVRRFRDEVFTLWRCTGCGSIHCAESVDLDRYYAGYPLQLQKFTFHERLGYRNRLRLLERMGLGRQDRILDYGCGAGLFVDYLKGLGLPRVAGYDAFAPRFTDPAVLGETYDAVVSYDVLEHAEDPRAFLEGLAALVRPGGLLVVGTPNADHVPIARDGGPALHPPYHRHILSERALLALGRGLGLEALHVHRRSFYDSLMPTVNTRFLCAYLRRAGGLVDVVVEPPRVGMVLCSPTLLFLAFFGYFLPTGDSMLVTFRRP